MRQLSHKDYALLNQLQERNGPKITPVSIQNQQDIKKSLSKHVKQYSLPSFKKADPRQTRNQASKQFKS